MKRVLIIDPFSGASGDMLLSALCDAGAPIDTLNDQLHSIEALARVRLGLEAVKRGHFAAQRLVLDLPHEHAHRGLSDVTSIIESGRGLSETVRSRARDTFTRLAMAEAKVHGSTAEQVHFHEVGALDAIVDIVGFFIAVEALQIDTFAYTRIVLGSGTTTGAHGEIPVPAPATLELLDGHEVTFSGRNEELVTPTAAAIIASTFSPVGAHTRVRAGRMGYGAGTRERDGLPNILRVTVGEAIERPREISVIRCTIDDMNPEFFGHVMAELFETGAREVYFHPVMMKKNRPGVELTVLAEETDVPALTGYVMRNTTTLGVRVTREERIELERRSETVATAHGEARVKVALVPGGGERVSPEYESCREISRRSGLPIGEVFDLVKRAWYDRDA